MATKVTNGLDLSSQKIVNVADPTADQDAATKKYVDDHNWASTDITDFAEAVDDQVNTLIVAGTGITKTYDDGAGTLTLEARAGTYKVTTFTESGSWTVDPNARWVEVYAIGGGSGGSAGEMDATSGGGAVGGVGGAGGKALAARYPAAIFTSSISITVGAGGTGGAGRTTTGATNPGTEGGTSLFGSLLVTNTAVALFSGAGGSGGGVSTTNVVTAGSAGSAATQAWNYSTQIATYGYKSGGNGGAIGDASNGYVGQPGSTPTSNSGSTLGNGGGGGGGGTYKAGTGNVIYGGNGGNGGIPGGGGGGGGGINRAANSSGSVSGAGGNGGRGEIVILEWLE